MKSGHFVIDILIPKLITPIKFFNMVLGIEKYFQISNVTVQYLKILLFRLFLAFWNEEIIAEWMTFADFSRERDFY